MSASSVVVGLVGGGAAGTVASGLLTTAHDRTERRRDRMIAAADAFLAAYDRYVMQLTAVAEAQSKFVANSRGPIDAASNLQAPKLQAALEAAMEKNLAAGLEFESTRPRLLVLFGGGSVVDERCKDVVADLQEALALVADDHDEAKVMEVLRRSGADVEAFAQAVGAVTTRRFLYGRR